MKKAKTKTAETSNPDQSIRILSTDIDGTLIGHSDALLRFNGTWNQLKKVNRPILCYNTGRLVDDMLDLIERESMLEPDYMICGVGTNIYDFRKRQSIKSFQNVLEEGWDLKVVEAIMQQQGVDVSKQPKRFQNPFKSSWYLDNANIERIFDIEHQLEDRGYEVNVVYSSGRDLDVLPKYANKGNALSWLLRHLDLKREQALVSGDSGNDTAMFHKRGTRGIIVGNAQPELHQATIGLPVYRAKGNCADGILEGLLHYGVITKISEIDHANTPESRHESIHPPLRKLLQEENCKSLEKPERAQINEGYKQAITGLRACISPMGFLACSPTINSSSGTDENYRSVWARDGCITVIGTLRLAEQDIQNCQRATLDTLLDNISITGQAPAYVSLDTQESDYSGVGGICSIDSGLWLIIACFEYARARKDIEFIRNRRHDLQRMMDWLSAHDSNNDGLLEIPEAGDWTDLFGRSYNVLYDEALWFRANICYGRMLEMTGEWRMAGDYLRWASVIKKSILEKFWPSTLSRENGVYSFADMQSSIGDTQYLIAQVTPFDFDWRCDVYANILAFLFDVVNVEYAQKTFRFMWGVGVNQPFPVANLYPPVQAGDPGWRDYYTVNLLNLPNHYHNGGIWPFVGAQWVRFINKLGLRELAESELVRVAQLNEQGVSQAWEFNEWCHGETGKPMGKMIQAWSCSEYINACHELKIVKPK